MAQSGYTPIQLYYSATALAAPTSGNLNAGELAINTNDGKLYYKDSGGVVQLIASKAGAAGDVVGPASATDGNLAAFDGTTGKLIKQAATVTAAQGGTGQSSYTVGDLVYASAATTLAKLADVATGNALISGGVGVAPSYGKIGLTTHVSGTLPVANGGTGLTTYAVGDIVYASGAGTLASLADVATGNALISGGVGVAPSYGKIGLTTHVSGTLPAANGGTGQSSYTVGDLVYASGATTIAKLADVATGNALISGGVGVAPSYGKIGLTTHVSGTLPVANGGTGLASYTTNHIPYASGATTLTTSANLTFNGTKLVVSGINFSRGNGNVSTNIAIGEGDVLSANSTGTENIAIGGAAGETSSTGSQNIFIGAQAATTLETGSNNIYIGTFNDASSTSVSNEIVIGYTLMGKGTQTAYIGGTSGAYNAKNVTTWETTSDERIKKNIAPFSGGLDVLNQIEVKNFEYRTKEEITELDPSVVVERSGIQIGIIAQELQQVLPQCVTQNATGVLSVNTDSLVWYLINAVKQLSAEVELLKQR